MKAKCTPSEQRRITHWEHEAVIEAMQQRLDEMPDAMRVRRSVFEHVFGAVKGWIGRDHFRMRRLANVRTEISLHVLAYNLKRAVAPRHSCAGDGNDGMRAGSLFTTRDAQTNIA